MSPKIGHWVKHFPPGYSFKIKDCSKRSDGEWYSRWTWELRDCNEDYVKQCEWWGFDTMEDALNDLAEHIEKTYGVSK
jgi:hypothetical protein